eukprot:531209_1
MESDQHAYDQDVVDQLVQMGVGNQTEIIFASKQTVNYKNINNVLETVNRIKDSIFHKAEMKDNYHEDTATIPFKLNWHHIASAIKQELNKKLSLLVLDVVNKHNITINDSPQKASKTLLKIIRDKKRFVTEREIQDIQNLIQRAITFNPSTISNTNPQNNKIKYKSPIKRFKFSKNKAGLLAYLWRFREQYVITSSDLTWDSEELDQLIPQRSNYMIQTKKSATSSFIAIQLKEVKIQLKGFSLQNYKINVKDCNVLFQAGHDGETWFTVRQFDSHDIQNSLHSWKVSDNTLNGYFSHFRLVSNPKNSRSNSNAHNLKCCGLELYGSVVMMNQDILDVFREYKFSNYHLENITPNDVHKSLINFTEFNFYPYYVVDDNMFDVFSYFFAISKYISIRNQNNVNNKYTVEAYVKCKNIVSIYDDKLTHVDKNNVEKYLISNDFINFAKQTMDYNNVNDIYDYIQSGQSGQSHDLLIIVDRKQSKVNDILYVTLCNRNEVFLHELTNDPYCIGMTFNTLPSTNRVYFTYGHCQRNRFFPEQLTSIITRIFKK